MLFRSVATTRFGLHATALVYAASLAALAAAAVGLLLLRPDAGPARPSPAARAVMPPGPGTTPPCRQAMNPGDGDPARTRRSGG